MLVCFLQPSSALVEGPGVGQVLSHPPTASPNTVLTVEIYPGVAFVARFTVVEWLESVTLPFQTLKT